MHPKRILLYYPPNKRSVAIETLCKAVHDAGHELVVLTLTERGTFHEEIEKKGIKTYTKVLTRKSGLRYFIRHALYLRQFCRQHKINMVWSHLQEGNIIAVMARPFIKARLITFRHHAESAFYAEVGSKLGLKRNKKEVFLDKIINRLAPEIIVPSSDVWNSMEKYEKCKMNKVQLLPYIYDFSAYPKPDKNKAAAIRDQYACSLLLIMVSRMIVSKQHMPVFTILKKLVEEGLSIKMIVMDDGLLRHELEDFIKENSLQDHIFLVGFRDDFVNYMTAADLLMHPSLTEASNNVVKEMGLLQKAVAVCRQVGDFSDYIIEGCNGYFLEKNRLHESIELVIRDAYNDPDKLPELGKNLRNDVLKRFTDSMENRQRFLQLLN